MFYRLYDADIEEISLVDHAANKRRFLEVVGKRAKGGVGMGEAAFGWEEPGVWQVFFELAAEPRPEGVEKQMELFVAGKIATKEDIKLDAELEGTFTGKILSTYGAYPGPYPPSPYGRLGLLKVEGVLELPAGLKVGQDFECPGRFTFTAPYGHPDVMPTREAKVAGKLTLEAGRALDEGGQAQVFLRNLPQGYAYPYPYPAPYAYPYPAPKLEDFEALKAKVEEAETVKAQLEEATKRASELATRVEELAKEAGALKETLGAVDKRLGLVEKALPSSRALADDGAADVKKGFWAGVVPTRR